MMKPLMKLVLAGLFFAPLAYAGPGSRTEHSCDLVDPVSVYKRLLHIKKPVSYTCFNDGATYFTYVIRNRDGTFEVQINFEDQFDGTWYGSYFDDALVSKWALPDVEIFDMTLEQVEACRAAFEPPVDCSEPF